MRKDGSAMITMPHFFSQPPSSSSLMHNPPLDKYLLRIPIISAKHPLRYLLTPCHLPPRSIPFRPKQSSPRLFRLCLAHTLPWHNHSIILHDPTRRVDEPACRYLPSQRPESVHWPSMHGQPPKPRVLSRRITRSSGKEHASYHLSYQQNRRSQ